MEYVLSMALENIYLEPLRDFISRVAEAEKILALSPYVFSDALQRSKHHNLFWMESAFPIFQ